MKILSDANFLMKDLPFLNIEHSKEPAFKPNQFLYDKSLSTASTAATESSQSSIVVTADSIIISSTPALSDRPTLLLISTLISIYKLLFFNKIDDGFL